MRYRNFRLALYFTVRCIENYGTTEELERAFRFFEDIGVSKVRLETHRDDLDAPSEKLRKLRDFFESRGVQVSGAITTTETRESVPRPFFPKNGVWGSGGTVFSGERDQERGRVCSTLCYTDPEAVGRLLDTVSRTAGLFDEMILDDFFSTSCTCPRCVRERGDRTWAEFRCGKMLEISRGVVDAARRANPAARVIIKYPNWQECFAGAGYDPAAQAAVFDGLYTGAETRDPVRSPQHLPRYGSWSLFRWLESVSPGRNSGAWIDPLDCAGNPRYFLEQAALPLLAGGRELTLFCASWLSGSGLVPMLGQELKRLDGLLSCLPGPRGVPVFEPTGASGESHLTDVLGMCGLPLEPRLEFPRDGALSKGRGRH